MGVSTINIVLRCPACHSHRRYTIVAGCKGVRKGSGIRMHKCLRCDTPFKSIEEDWVSYCKRVGIDSTIAPTLRAEIIRRQRAA